MRSVSSLTIDANKVIVWFEGSNIRSRLGRSSAFPLAPVMGIMARCPAGVVTCSLFKTVRRTFWTSPPSLRQLQTGYHSKSPYVIVTWVLRSFVSTSQDTQYKVPLQPDQGLHLYRSFISDPLKYYENEALFARSTGSPTPFIDLVGIDSRKLGGRLPHGRNLLVVMVPRNEPGEQYIRKMDGKKSMVFHALVPITATKVQSGCLLSLDLAGAVSDEDMASFIIHPSIFRKAPV